MELPRGAIVLELPPFWLNQSRWKEYMDCPRLYAWQHVENLEPTRPRGYLQLGTAIHKAQEVAHAGDGTQEAFDEALKVAEQTFKAGMAAAGPSLPGDDEQVAEGLETIKRMLPAYRAYYVGTGQLWKPLGMELEFCVEVGEGTGVFLVGKIDNLVTFMNGLWLVDYKTMGRLDLRDFLKYEIDVQLTAYIYGGTKQLTLDARKRGEPPVVIRGAIIDGMIKTKVPQFHRELYTRTIDDLREFELEWVETAREMARKHQRVRNGEPWKVVFPKNTQQCFRYGTCAFRDLCVKDNEVRRMAFRKRRPDYVDKATMVGLQVLCGAMVPTGTGSVTCNRFKFHDGVCSHQ